MPVAIALVESSLYVAYTSKVVRDGVAEMRSSRHANTKRPVDVTATAGSPAFGEAPAFTETFRSPPHAAPLLVLARESTPRWRLSVRSCSHANTTRAPSALVAIACLKLSVLAVVSS